MQMTRLAMNGASLILLAIAADAGCLRKPPVEKDDVRSRVWNQLRRLTAVGRLADEIHVGLRFD